MQHRQKSKNERFLKLSNEPRDLIRIGTIVGAHGIRGAVKAQSFSDTGDCFSRCRDLILMDAAGRMLDQRIEWARPHKNGMRLGIEDITTRNQAEALIGCDIFIERASLPPLDPDTNYWIDLIGMAVYTLDDECIGRIVNIIPTGANDVYVVEPTEGDATDEILLPAIETVVIDVDVPGKRMRVDVPAGLM